MISTASIVILVVAVFAAISTMSSSNTITSIQRTGRALQSIYNKNKSGTTNLIVVLGCDNNRLLEDRMEVALNKVSGMEGNIIWYLTGGVKRYNDKGGEIITEASKMLHILKNEGNTNAVVVDDKAQNTAENFVKLKEWMDHINEDMNVNIVTSAFHFIRAKAMFERILPNIQATWELGYISCSTCLSDEIIHRSHIIADVDKALEKENTKKLTKNNFQRGHTLDPIPEYIQEERA